MAEDHASHYTGLFVRTGTGRVGQTKKSMGAAATGIEHDLESMVMPMAK
jgi:hypothetical protein